MTPFRRWLHRTAEKALGRYYEGPEPPGRIRAEVEHFAAQHPAATRGQWAEFAAGLAEEFYRSGYLRGVDYAERSVDWRPDVPPEVLADWIDPGWKGDDRGISPLDPSGIPPERGPTEESVMRGRVEEMIVASARER